MKRIAVFSDSHGSLDYMEQSLILHDSAKKIDAVIHCGDGAEDIERLTGSILQVIAVRGNCDSWLCDYEIEKCVTIGGVRIFVTHGHRYNVKYELDTLADRARSLGAQVACFGHTHCPLCEEHNGVLLLNPGSCSSHSASAILTIGDSGLFRAELY